MKKTIKKAKGKQKQSVKRSATRRSPSKSLRSPKSESPQSKKDILLEVADLRQQLSEAEETLTAIRKGEVDALVVNGPQGDQVYALRSADQPYRILVESMNEGALTLTKAGTIVNCNKAFANMAHEPCGNLIGTSFKDLVSKDDRVEFEAFWKRAVKKETKTEIELNFYGRLVPVYLSLSPRVCEGECLVFAVVTDISERKKADEELSKYRLHLERMVDEKTHEVQTMNEELQTLNEELQTTNEELQTTNEQLITSNEQLATKTAELETIISSMSDSVIYSDLKQRIVLANPATSEIFGYSQDELVGRSKRMLYADESGFEKMEKERRASLHPGNRPSFEILYRRRDKTDFIGETLTAPIRDAKGAPIGFVSIHRDITERKKYENNILKLNNELHRHILWLQEANREIEAFSYSVSHDLRAPLRFIAGFTEAIQDDETNRLSDTSKDYFHRVRAATEKMGRLIDALLDLSQATRRELKRTRTDMSAAARAAVEGLQRSHPDRRVECVIADNVIVDGDAAMLGAVITNLLQNAWKFTSKTANARIEFGAFECGMRNSEFGMKIQEHCEQGKTIYFIRDNGAGFDMTYRNKLFSAFQRLHTADDFPGIGIGLATVQRIIHLHGGKVWAEGEVGKGATFFFTLG